MATRRWSGTSLKTDQVVAVEFREGNESPNKENLQFIQRCESALPEGVSVSDVRIDAAGYQAAVINYAMDSGMGFAIRAKMDSAVKETLSEIKDCEWRHWCVVMAVNRTQNRFVARCM